MEMSVCILGANGFIGKALCRELEKSGCPWIGIDRQSGDMLNTAIIDLNHTDKILGIIEKYPMVINASGSLKPKDFINDFENAMEVFWEHLQSIVEILHTGKVSKFIHISSAGTVYGENFGTGSTENEILRPKSWYGKTKVIEEKFFRNACLDNNIEFLCVRATNPFGKSELTRHGFVDVLINSVKKQGRFSIFFQEGTTRDFIFIEDMSKMIITLLFSEEKGFFNVASGKSIPLESLLKYVKDNFKNVNIDYKETYDETDIRHSKVSIEKYKTKYGEVEFKNVFDYITEKSFGH